MRFNALSAVAGIFLRTDAGSRRHKDVVTSAVQEAVSVARASGVSI